MICVVMLCPLRRCSVCRVYLGGQCNDNEKVQLFRISFICSSRCSDAAWRMGVGYGIRNCPVSVSEGNSHVFDGFCFDRQNLDRRLVTDHSDSSDSFAPLSALPFLLTCLSDRFC